MDPRHSIFDTGHVISPPGHTLASAGSTPVQSPTKSKEWLAEVDWTQASQNKYAVGAGVGVLTIVLLLLTSPSFVATETGVDYQLVLAIGIVGFVLVVWGPDMYALCVK